MVTRGSQALHYRKHAAGLPRAAQPHIASGGSSLILRAAPCPQADLQQAQRVPRGRCVKHDAAVVHGLHLRALGNGSGMEQIL